MDCICTVYVSVYVPVSVSANVYVYYSMCIYVCVYVHLYVHNEGSLKGIPPSRYLGIIKYYSEHT